MKVETQECLWEILFAHSAHSVEQTRKVKRFVVECTVIHHGRKGHEVSFTAARYENSKMFSSMAGKRAKWEKMRRYALAVCLSAAPPYFPREVRAAIWAAYLAEYAARSPRRVLTQEILDRALIAACGEIAHITGKGVDDVMHHHVVQSARSLAEEKFLAKEKRREEKRAKRAKSSEPKRYVSLSGTARPWKPAVNLSASSTGGSGVSGPQPE